MKVTAIYGNGIARESRICIFTCCFVPAAGQDAWKPVRWTSADSKWITRFECQTSERHRCDAFTEHLTQMSHARRNLYIVTTRRDHRCNRSLQLPLRLLRQSLAITEAPYIHCVKSLHWLYRVSHLWLYTTRDHVTENILNFSLGSNDVVYCQQDIVWLGAPTILILLLCTRI